MKRRASIVFLAFFITIFAPFAAVFAHQPRIVARGPVQVSEPEVSKAYYDELSGGPRIYRIEEDKPWNLYLNILVPKESNGSGRYDAILYDVNSGKNVAVLESVSRPWEPYWEEFGRDWYMRGPEMRRQMPAGKFEVVVTGGGNEGKYSLAIGEKENFPVKEIISTVGVLPKLKRWFFETNPATFAFSPFGAGYIAAMFALSALFGVALRFGIKKFGTKKGKASRRIAGRAGRISERNIGLKDRLARVGVGAILLALAITTTWNPLVLFLSGFMYFEAFAGWCGLYAAFGRNTCTA